MRGVSEILVFPHYALYENNLVMTYFMVKIYRMNSVWVLAFKSKGPVHEIQIKALKAEVTQRLPTGSLNILRLMVFVPKFTCNKKVFPNEKREEIRFIFLFEP